MLKSGSVVEIESDLRPYVAPEDTEINCFYSSCTSITRRKLDTWWHKKKVGGTVIAERDKQQKHCYRPYALFLDIKSTKWLIYIYERDNDV